MALDLSFNSLRRRRRVVLEGASLHLPEGRGVGVIGLNGSGKTTFLMAAAGLLHGAGFKLNGRETTAVITGFVPQNAPLPHWLRVGAIFSLFGTTLSAAAASHPGLRLEELEGLSVRGLTPGQRQAVVAAAALMLSADALVLDEPFAGLDFHRQSALRAALVDAALVRTVIVSAQSITDILGICDRFIILSNRAITFAGRLDDLGLPADTSVDVFERAITDMLVKPRLEVST